MKKEKEETFSLLCASFWTAVKIILQTVPEASVLDPIPAKLLHKNFEVLLPTVNILNKSFTSGTVPSDFKSAVVKPLLKKSSSWSSWTEKRQITLSVNTSGENKSCSSTTPYLSAQYNLVTGVDTSQRLFSTDATIFSLFSMNFWSAAFGPVCSHDTARTPWHSFVSPRTWLRHL